MPSIFNFVTKEGKHFAPIVNEAPASYRIATQEEINDPTVVKYTGDDGSQYIGVGTTEKSGVKGVFARVRFTSDDIDKAELFAVNTEAFRSSN